MFIPAQTAFRFFGLILYTYAVRISHWNEVVLLEFEAALANGLRWSFTAGMMLFGLGMALWMIRAAQREKRDQGKFDSRPVQAALAVWMASVVTGTAIGGFWERRPPLEQLDPSVISWAYLGGDGIALPAAAAVSAVGWRVMHPDLRRFFTHWGWRLFCVVAGGMGAALFHVREYVAAPDKDPFSTPTKIFHQAATYPALLIGLLCIGFPVLVNALMPGDHWRRRVLLALAVLACAGTWFELGVIDAGRDLSLTELHPTKWDWSWFPGPAD